MSLCICIYVLIIKTPGVKLLGRASPNLLKISLFVCSFPKRKAQWLHINGGQWLHINGGHIFTPTVSTFSSIYVVMGGWLLLVVSKKYNTVLR